MPYLPTAQSWLTQSTLLLQARPTTTRITSKYTLTPPSAKPSKSKTAPTTTAPAATTPEAPATRATLTLKTYDPISGTTLKYSTTKAAEVSRLIQILGRLARPMAGLEVKAEETSAVAKVEEVVGEVVQGVVETGKAVVEGAKGQVTGGGGGKGKKKKGKK